MEGGATLPANCCYYLTEKRGTRRSARTRHFDSSLYVITPVVGNPETGFWETTSEFGHDAPVRVAAQIR